MKLKSPKPIFILAIAMLMTATVFTACGGGDKKKDEPAKTDSPTPMVDTPKAPVVDTPAKNGGDTLKPKPTEQGD